MRRAFLHLFLFCILVPAAWPDAALDRAASSEKAGELDSAASQLAAWLASNPGSAGSPDVFADYLRVEQDFPRLLQTASSFLKTARGVAGAAAQFQRIARLFDLAGRVEEARDAYLLAHAEGAPDSTLTAAFVLSLRMNDTAAMSAALEQLKGGSPSARMLLNALSDLQSGNRAAARAALTGLAEQTGDPDLALKALWALYEGAQESGDSAGQSDARAKLGKRFASSPEAALAAIPSGPTTRRVVLPAPAPAALSPQPALAEPAPPQSPAASPPTSAAPSDPGPGTGQPLPASPAAASTPASDPAATSSSAPAAGSRFSVQAGSFQMKENADDLVAELTKRGFTPTVVHDSVQGRDRWRVLAGAGLDREAAEAVRRKLSSAGYLGVLVTDR